MSIFEIIGLIAGIAGIVGLIYTFYNARRSRRVKLLVYETTESIPLATAFSPEDEYKLSVLYQPKGHPEERIDSVYTRFLRFANLGKEPIRREDIALANSISITIEGVRTLDISLAGRTRSANNLSVQSLNPLEDNASATLSFDYLDYQDGGLVKVLTVGNKGTVRLSGDIIGMPSGIRRIEDISPKSLLSKLGWCLSLLTIFAFIALSFIAHYWVTGSWTNVWLLALPFSALIVALIIIITIGETIWPSSKSRFPPNLRIPSWYHHIYPFYPLNGVNP